MAAHEPPWDRRHTDQRLDRLEADVRALVEWRIGCALLVDGLTRELPDLRKAIDAATRQDAIAAGVATAMQSSETRGWTRKERGLALLGGMGVVCSLLLQALSILIR